MRDQRDFKAMALLFSLWICENFVPLKQLQTEAGADLHSSGLTERCEADYLRVYGLCRVFVAVFHILAGEEGRGKMDTDLKVDDFTHEQLFNDIKDLFCSVSDWNSRERGRSRALSAQRCFCGVFLFHFWLKDRSCIRNSNRP